MLRSSLYILVAHLVFVASGYCDDSYQVDIQPSKGSGLVLNFTLKEYTITASQHDNKLFSSVDFQGGVRTNIKGYAELPFVNASVAMPDTGAMAVEVIESSYVDIRLDHPLRPSKGVIYRNQNPQAIPYEVAPESISDQWFPQHLVRTTGPYIFRDIRGGNVYVYPFRYNAAKNILRVYERVSLSVVFDPTAKTINRMPRSRRTILPVMDNMYQSLFINYNLRERYRLDSPEAGDVLVLYTHRDEDAIGPYIQWKREKGYTVHSLEVVPGTHANENIKEQYELHPNLLYVQLVGDWKDIKSDLGSSGNAPMDPMLGCVSGHDDYPDLAVGRFSANTSSQVTVQVRKAIDYEKNPSIDGPWYAKGLGIGSEEGAGIGDDGESDVEHVDIIKEHKLLPFTYDDIKEIYEYGSASSVANHLNNGLGIINYVGHGNESGWRTTGFGNRNISDLRNGNRLPFIFSVACRNGAFHRDDDCFAESWLRKEDGGAVAALMSTINQPWTPPMRGQDYLNDILSGGYDYSQNPGSGTTTYEGRTTFGSIVLNSMVLMYSESSLNQDLDTIQTWTTFGDATLQVRTSQPKSIEISGPSVSSGALFSLHVTSDNQAVPTAMVCLQQDGRVFSGWTDSAGRVSIDHTLEAGKCTLVVSGFNLMTKYVELDVKDGGGVPAPANFRID